ncbi:pollen-specific leucine-rich repeat extensin-like protein 1 [Nilaparvata lugens]|uniref:pollen-specific leucine-rich repeat extensin-like protein 1 n=1 Tax=Nilaparvata lugens TaxID=108931 RepID=UPI00193CCB3E|nr:pollen-specific leucine-rich repeat extensin-like protein 1 [Nilaparvata lugens]
MSVSLGFILFLSCLFCANGYPVQSRPSLLLTYLPDNWTVMGQSRRVHPFGLPDPTQTLICRVMLPVLDLSTMIAGGGAGGSSLPLYILPGEPQFVLRRRVSYQPDMDIEPWEVLAYTPNSNSQEPDITSLLAAPAPVLCVSPDRPRPHPVLLAPVPPMSPAELRPPPHQPLYRPPSEGSLYSIQAAPPPTPHQHGLPIEPSINPAILESLIYSAQNKPVFVSPDRVEQSPNGPPPYYKPHHDSTKSELNPQESLHSESSATDVDYPQQIPPASFLTATGTFSEIINNHPEKVSESSIGLNQPQLNPTSSLGGFSEKIDHPERVSEALTGLDHPQQNPISSLSATGVSSEKDDHSEKVLEASTGLDQSQQMQLSKISETETSLGSGDHPEDTPISSKSLLGAKDGPELKIVPGYLTQSEIDAIKKEDALNNSKPSQSLSSENEHLEVDSESAETTEEEN